MSLNNIKSDLTHVFDTEPEWITHLKYNPLLDIIEKGKPYHIIALMRYVFGAKNSNPIISNLKFFYYKDPQVKSIFEEIKFKANNLRGAKSQSDDDFIDILTLLAKIDYFEVYNKKYIDILIKEIIASNMILNMSNFKYRSVLIFLINKLGYGNVFLERGLKNIQKYQNSDGGWSLDLNDSSKKSDIFSTLMVYRSFISNNLWKNKDFLINAEEYLIENHLSKKQTNEELDRWNRLHAGYKKNNLFEGGSAILLDCLLLSKNRRSDKIKSIISWIKGMQLKTGYFPYHASLKNQENTSCTIKILSLIKKYYII